MSIKDHLRELVLQALLDLKRSGQITLDGTGEQLLGDDRVRRAYLGED